MNETPPVPPQPAPTADPPALAPVGLTFADGFQFGCGFMVATVLSVLILLLALVVLAFVLSLFGISLL